MEARTKKKTKAEIEKDFPIIHPEDCPKKLMEWMVLREASTQQTLRLLIREELKPVRRFMRMAFQNRIWLIILSAVVVVIGFVLIYHLSVR